MALVSADSRIAELLTELHQLIKQTQVKSQSSPLQGSTGSDAKLWRGGERVFRETGPAATKTAREGGECWV